MSYRMNCSLVAGLMLVLHASSLMAQDKARIDLKGEMAIKTGSSDTGVTTVQSSESLIYCEQKVTGDKWAKFAISFTPAADGKVELLVRGQYLKSGVEVWIDYDKLELTGATITNGDFEEKGETGNSPAAWECKKWSKSKVVRGKDGANPPYSGEAYVVVSHSNRIWQSIDVKKDQPVTLSVYARLDAQSAGGGEKKEDKMQNPTAASKPIAFAEAAAPRAVVQVTAAAPVSGEAQAAENPAFEAMLAKLPQPMDVVNGESSNWRLKNGAPNVGVMSVVDVEGMPFTKAVRMASVKRPDRDYMFQNVTPTTAPIAVGDVLLLTFYARATQVNNETGVGQVNIKCFSMAGLGTAASGSAAVTKEWQKFYFPSTMFSKSVKEFAPGELTLTMNQGLQPQVVEIADVRLVKYPEGVSTKDLPHMVVTYEGRELDAPWRKPAEERIEKIRKADLAVQVVDQAGKPVADAQVQVRMKRHAFGFGSALAGTRLDPQNNFSKSEDSQRYREEVLKLFNVATCESDLKWEPWLEHRDGAIRAVQWLREQNIPVRGHTLVWPQLDRLPYAMRDQQKQAYYRSHLDELQKLQMDHIRDEMTALKGMCFEWDLINEAMSHFDYQNLMGMDCFLEYFKLAHEIDPTTRLLVNENKLLNSDGGVGSISFSREDDFYNFLKYLKDHGAALDGIGIQSHWGGVLTPPDRMLQQLDRFAEFGSISITEFSMGGDDELKCDVMRDFLTMCFSHPAINTFIMWGFWDGQHYRKDAPIFRKDWSLKPSGQVFMDLVFKKWWTNLDGATDANGSFRGRGFMGDYEITVTHQGHTQTVNTALARDSGVIKVTLDE